VRALRAIITKEQFSFIAIFISFSKCINGDLCENNVISLDYIITAYTTCSSDVEELFPLTLKKSIFILTCSPFHCLSWIEIKTWCNYEHEAFNAPLSMSFRVLQFSIFKLFFLYSEVECPKIYSCCGYQRSLFLESHLP
jgi:hypothetical protein